MAKLFNSVLDFGLGKVEIKITNPLDTILNDTQKAALNVTKNDTVMKELGHILIELAKKDYIIPYQEKYKLRAEKKDRKTGRVKQVSPSEVYYFMGDYQNDFVNTTSRKSFTRNYKSVTTKTTKKDGVISQTTTSKGGVRKISYASGLGLVATSRKRGGRIPWAEYKTESYLDENRQLRPRVVSGQYGVDRDTQTVKTKKGTEYQRTTTKYWAYRPPHLDDTDKTHKVSVKNHVANITIKNKKRKDKHFSDVGGEEYAIIQYYADDADWNRHTAGTTSRWLEVAVGEEEPARDDVFVNAKKNRQIMAEYVRWYVDKKIRGKK